MHSFPNNVVCWRSIDAFSRIPYSKICNSLLFWRTVCVFPGWLKLNWGLKAIIASQESFSWWCQIAPLGILTDWECSTVTSAPLGLPINSSWDSGHLCLKCSINRSLCSHGPLQCCQKAAASALQVTAALQLRAALCSSAASVSSYIAASPSHAAK